MRRFVAVLGCCFVLAVSVDPAGACWWSHHCHCRHGGSYGSARFAEAPSAAVAAPSAATAAAPAYYYQPVMMAPVVQAAPAQSLVGQLLGIGGVSGVTNDLTAVVELLKMVKSLRDRDAGSGGGPGGGGGSGDVTGIQSKLDLLLEGQQDLKGRLINNAGIGQSIGERLVKIDEKLDEVIAGGGRVARKENAGSEPAAPPADQPKAPEDLPAAVVEIKKRTDALEQRIKALDDLDKKLDGMLDKRFSELDSKLEKKFEELAQKLQEGRT